VNRYEEAAELFADRVGEEYFDSRSAETAKHIFLKLLEKEERPLLFLLGEPGSGKTHMLKTLERVLTDKGWRVFLFNDPFESGDELTRRLAAAAAIAVDGDGESLKKPLVDAFGAMPHLVMLDEAQLLNEEVFEYIRILNDTGAFRFVMAMHRKEGEAILSKPHFRSRSHRVVEMGGLDRGEIRRYAQKRLEDHGFDTFAAMLSEREIGRLYRYTRGNFRMTKRMLQSLFSLMGEARELGREKFTRPNATLWCMAALDTGVEHA